MSFFVYELKANGETRYVGFTTNLKDRLWKHVNDTKKGSGTHCCNWLRQVLAKGGYPEIEIIREVDSKKKACFYERVYISAYLEEGYRLTNMTDGGEGGAQSEEVMLKIGEKLRGRVSSEETRRKISDGLHRLYQENPDERKKRGDARRGKHHSAETRKRIGESNTGRVTSEKTKVLLSASKIGKALTAEHRASIGSGLEGGKRTDEQRVTMKEAQQRFWASEAGKEIAAKRAVSNTGRTHTEETKQRLRKPKSEETKQKLREAALRRHVRERAEREEGAA